MISKPCIVMRLIDISLLCKVSSPVSTVLRRRDSSHGGIHSTQALLGRTCLGYHSNKAGRAAHTSCDSHRLQWPRHSSRHISKTVTTIDV